ncbi:MAG: PEGA domain-containing protein [Lachnospiraceae bacterium]
MDRRRKRLLTATLLMLLCLCGLSGCNNNQQTQEVQAEETAGGFVALAPGAYDSGDTAVVVKKQVEKNTITFFNLIKGRNYTLNYDGSSRFYDKYGSAISLAQLSEGEIVELQFLKESRQLVNLQISDKIWTMDGVGKFELELSGGKVKILDEWYVLAEDALILSEGKEVELMDINAQDILEVRGVGHDIYSIVIDKGHGYLRLTNDEYFIGGWIEVGQKLIRRIEPDMLLVVPEGTYEVFLSHSGIEGVKEIQVARNREVELDVGDIRKDDLVKYGTLIFTVEPSSAEVYLDGKSIDISRTVKAEYGLHQVVAKAEGYETIIQYIKVSQGNATVAISLDKEKDRTVSGNGTTAQTSAGVTAPNSTATNTGSVSVSNNTTSANTGSSTSVSGNNSGTNTTISGNTSTGSTTGYKVTIEAPAGAEIYVDGTYVGIAPVSFAKKSGKQEVTIRRGYQLRTYTIDVDKEEKDISYSFSD